MVTLLLGVVVVAGCGADSSSPNKIGGVAGKVDKAARKAARAPEPGDAPAQAEKEDPAKKQEAAGSAPKIIYTARLELSVADLDRAESDLISLVKERKGYIVRSDPTGEPGVQRRGSWTFRVPVAAFDGVIKAIVEFGEVLRNSRESEDITDRYYDTEAAMTNLEAREKALRKLLDEKIGGSKLADLLEVDRELWKVRGEINQLKGQLNRWDKETTFATVQLEMHERKGYVPETAPPFATRIDRTFDQSIMALIEAGQGITLFAVAVGPWLGVLAVIGLPVWGIVRLVRRRTRTVPPVVPPAGQTAAQS